MKNTINIILYSVLTVLVAASIAIGIAGHRRQVAAVKCTGIAVELIDSSQHHFISEKEVIRILDREYGGYRNVPAGNLDLEKMEAVLDQHGMLERHDAYFTSDGILHIRVSQRTPYAKVREGNALWYICKGGRCFRVNNDWCPDIPQVYGASQISNELWRQRTAELGEYIMGRRDWKRAVEKVGCDSRGEVSIRLRDRKEVFYLGQPTALKEKFKKIDLYLSDISPKLPEDKTYRSVNVKFSNQIVCR